MKDRYTGLYDNMAQSQDPKNMKAFGCVMTEMMDYLIQNKPDVAEEMIDKLEAIKWRQYLTPKEAEKIVADARSAADREKSEILASAQKEITDMVTEAMEKLTLEQSASDAFDQFLDAAEETKK